MPSPTLVTAAPTVPSRAETLELAAVTAVTTALAIAAATARRRAAQELDE